VTRLTGRTDPFGSRDLIRPDSALRGLRGEMPKSARTSMAVPNVTKMACRSASTKGFVGCVDRLLAVEKERPISIPPNAAKGLAARVTMSSICAIVRLIRRRIPSIPSSVQLIRRRIRLVDAPIKRIDRRIRFVDAPTKQIGRRIRLVDGSV